MIKSEKIVNRDGSVTYYLYDGQKIFFNYTVDKNMNKADLIDAFFKSHSYDDATFSPAKIKKDVIKALGNVDEDFHRQYRLNYPWGGKRENSGRKKGSHNRNKRTERTEKLRNSITIEEKNLLKVVLKYYRENIATADSKIKEDFDINILRQLT